MHYFDPFPKVKYDIKRNGKETLVTDISLRFKIRDALKKRAAVYYDYIIQDGDRPDTVSWIYYEDATLDWLIFLVNNIIDPLRDWPLNHNNFNTMITKKYGSNSAAYSQTHHYEQVIRQQSVLFDGTIIRKKVVVVDEGTYNSLNETDRDAISVYDYELGLNDAKRQIRLLDKRFLSVVMAELENVFE